MTESFPIIAVTPGEPAGIGPDLLLTLAQSPWPVQLIAIADIGMLQRRAAALDINVDLQRVENELPMQAHVPRMLQVRHVPLAETEVAGQLNPANADYVLQTLQLACTGCVEHAYTAMVTGPVQKSVINDAGIPFSGHTEFLAQLCEVERPVMMLVAGRLRVALVTTHLALRNVPDAIDADRVRTVTSILHRDLEGLFGINNPRIVVLGLNPHAGEDGHLGSEDRDVIAPVLDELRGRGLRVNGPLPADTAFTQPHLEHADAVLAMYHDQGLPVLKNRGFGRAVNVTLGLPIIRTSVDHGTALDLAATGRGDDGSLRAALELAIELASHRSR